MTPLSSTIVRLLGEYTSLEKAEVKSRYGNLHPGIVQIAQNFKFHRTRSEEVWHALWQLSNSACDIPGAFREGSETAESYRRKRLEGSARYFAEVSRTALENGDSEFFRQLSVAIAKVENDDGGWREKEIVSRAFRSMMGRPFDPETGLLLQSEVTLLTVPEFQTVRVRQGGRVPTNSELLEWLWAVHGMPGKVSKYDSESFSKRVGHWIKTQVQPESISAAVERLVSASGTTPSADDVFKHLAEWGWGRRWEGNEAELNTARRQIDEALSNSRTPQGSAGLSESS